VSRRRKNGSSSPRPRADEEPTAPAGAPDDQPTDVRPPDARIADARIADARVADARVADARVADARVADARVADARPPEVRTLHGWGAAPDGRAADARIPDARVPDARSSDGQLADARASDGRRPAAPLAAGSFGEIPIGAERSGKQVPPARNGGGARRKDAPRGDEIASADDDDDAALSNGGLAGVDADAVVSLGDNAGLSLDDISQPVKKPDEPKKATIADAVWIGVKDAGAPVVRFLDIVGGHLILVGRALSWLVRPPMRTKNFLEAAEYIGFGSLPIVLLVGCFTGMVLSLQSIAAFRQFGLESFSGGTTGKALSTELGPVLTSLMLAGRAGAGIATELGTMRITEQIDALESMAVNPVQFLVTPRIISAMVVTPILTLLFFIIGMGGAYLVAVPLEHVDQGSWVANLRDITQVIDVIQGMVKAIFFGFMVALVGCYQGFNAKGGGRGVGMGTTRAVVIASVTTLVMDYFLSDIWLSIFGTGKGH
jgi:phospholipid/cholesterol/gamma-HCH transport system permease protein